MWKYITRNVRETLERRICSSLTDKSGQDKSSFRVEDRLLPCLTNIISGDHAHKTNTTHDRGDYKTTGQKDQCADFGDNNSKKEKTQQESWNSGAHIGQSWLNALGWSTALVLSWNLLQPLCRLRLSDREQKCPFAHGPPQFMCWKGRGFNPRHFRKAPWHFHSHHAQIDQEEPGDVRSFQFNAHDFEPYQEQPGGKWGYKYTPPDSHTYEDQPDGKWTEYHDTTVPKSESLKDQSLSYDLSYSNIWKILSHTVLAQPLHVLPKQGETENKRKQVHVNLVEYGPPTAEQALQNAAENFAAVQNSVMSDIDNQLGVELMQNGRHHEAISLFSRAVESNNAAAAFNLGVCHEMGLGTNQNFKEAAKYYQLASKHGHATAMYNLGVFHIHGWGGLPADSGRAHELFQRASDLGQDDAKRALDMVKTQNPSPLEDVTDCNVALVQEAIGAVQKLGIGVRKVHTDIRDVDMGSNDYKDISDMVHNSILKYTEMLQKQ